MKRVLFVVLLLASSAFAACTQLQVKKCVVVSANIACSFPLPTTAGSVIASVMIGVTSPSGQMPAVGDGANTYDQATVTTQTGGPSNESIGVGIAANAVSVTTVNYTFSGATNSGFAVYQYELTGCATTSPVDGQNGSSGASGTPNAGSITTTVNGDYLIAAAVSNGGAETAGSGPPAWTLDQSSTAFWWEADEVFPQTSAGAATGNFGGGSGTWAAKIFAIKGSGGSPPPSSHCTITLTGAGPC